MRRTPSPRWRRPTPAARARSSRAARASCRCWRCGWLTENPDPTREDIRAGLSGNICRCTGYAGIVDAVRQAAATMKD
jgi:hypothetical protein